MDRVYERFVECPGIVEIRWVSDDPDHHRPTEDVYYCQTNGIPEDYGKKNKRTTEQAHFYCCVCECQSASLKTLRAHCVGTQHKRKAEQFYQQFNYKERKESENTLNGPISDGQSIPTRKQFLFELRGSTPVVGLQYVEEYTSFEKSEHPLYICVLQGCKINNSEFKGNASMMFDHLNLESHGWSYCHRLYGTNFCQEDYDFSDLLEKILQEERPYGFQYYRMKPNQRDYKNVKDGHRPDSSYVREAIQKEREKNQLRKLPPKTERKVTEHLSSENSPIATLNSPNCEGKNVPSDNSGSATVRKRRLSEEGCESATDASKFPRATYSEENPLCVLPPSLQLKMQPQPDLSLVDENDLAEPEQPISNDLKSKIEIQPNSLSQNAPVIEAPETIPQLIDPVKKFNQAIADWVMACMNKYYQYKGNRETCIRKIHDKFEYQELAKKFSREYRRLEKDSYLSVNGTLDGLELNGDMKDRVKMNIDMYFENEPLLPLD